MVEASPQRPGQDHKPAPSPPSEGVGVALPPSSDADLALEPGSSSVPSQPPPEPPHTHGPPEPQSWLNTLVSDLASVFLFSGIGTALAVLTPLAGPRDVLGPLVAALGLWGVGVERGKIRPPSMAVCVLLSTWAAAIHFGGEVWFFGSAGIGLPLIARTALIAVIGAFLPIVATRFDRGETAWRISARCGPPTGFAPLAAAIAAWRAPTPVGWLLLLLLPLDLAARFLSVAAILGYQLTASRLMPSACRYEPTCSRYGFQAYLEHSWVKATLLTAFRVLRCSPLGSGGYDPIPRPAPLRPGPVRVEDLLP